MTTTTEVAVPSRTMRLLRSDRGPLVVHLLFLGVGLVVLLVLASRQWLFFDDWSFIAPRLTDIWAPHVGHWSTVPFLIFHAIRDTFGIDHFLPFAIPVIAAHLAFVHGIWRFMNKTGVLPWLATAFSVVLVFFGAGAENILWAFQIGYVGAMALAMYVVLIVMRDRLRPLDIALVVVLSVISLASSGTSLPLLLIAALISVTRRGWWRTGALFAVPGAAYLTWFFLRRATDRAGQPSSFSELVGGVPKFAIRMLTDGFGTMFPVAVLGPLTFIALAIWGVVSYRHASRAARPAYILFLAAPVFALLTGFSRIDLGIQTAVSSRYLYFAIPMMLPLLALGLGKLAGLIRLPQLAVVVLIGVLAAYNFGGMLLVLQQRVDRTTETRQGLSAALDLISSRPHSIDPNLQPFPLWAPDITVADLEAMSRSGWFHATSYPESARFGAVTQLELEVRPTSKPDEASTCDPMTPADAARQLDEPTFMVQSPQPASITIALGNSSGSGEPRQIVIPSGWTTVSLADDASAGSATFRVDSVTSTVELCPIP
jgi:hypothetical protein